MNQRLGQRRGHGLRPRIAPRRAIPRSSSGSLHPRRGLRAAQDALAGQAGRSVRKPESCSRASKSVSQLRKHVRPNRRWSAADRAARWGTRGCVEPAICQRQPGTGGKTAQAGTPKAPAIWTVALPTEITRSSAETLAANSIEVDQRISFGEVVDLRRPARAVPPSSSSIVSPYCRLIQWTESSAEQRLPIGQSGGALRRSLGCRRPARRCRLSARAQGRKALPPAVDGGRIGDQVMRRASENRPPSGASRAAGCRREFANRPAR